MKLALSVNGWLFDCYPSKDQDDLRGMTFWIKTEKGTSLKLRDRNWKNKIYAAGSACDDASFVFSKIKNSGLVSSVKEVLKIKDIGDRRKSPVLEIELERPDASKRVAEMLENSFQNPSCFKLYNVDVLPEQSYFYEHNLFPLAKVRVDVEGENVRRWHLRDYPSKINYSTPEFRILKLGIKIEGPVPKLDSKLLVASLVPLAEGKCTGIKIERPSEEELLLGMVEEVRKFDPDILITENGDSFVLPYLYSKARRFSLNLKLDRDPSLEDRSGSSSTGGKSYFSYGRILYRPSTKRLFGRLHLDEENTFIYDQCRLQGLYEVSRLCRIPLHTSARASIGKCLSGLQFYYAAKREILIPWKPLVAEDFKTGYDLIVGDRGGLVLTPLEGIHERVCELDFASLYPSIISDYNISAETVNCLCCPSNRMEELNMNICKRRKGIVAESLELPLEKKFRYKKLRDSTEDAWLKSVYNERAAALKWILVCCFGYLSYRNAKFGKIDSHMAVCAIARKTLRDAIHVANNRGFQVLHGIVDSLWVSKDRADFDDYEELRREIETVTGFKLAIEGIYKWIVFLPSKILPSNQVANRYFGCFTGTKEIKFRGIELRRRDTPIYFKKCQKEMLEELAKCDDEEELRSCARDSGIRIFEKYAKKLEDREVPATDLIITKRLSKELNEYSTQRQLSVNASKRLESEGLRLQAGQSVSYVITNYDSSIGTRALSEELIDSEDSYDSSRYVELLADCCATILSPFGITKEVLLTRSEMLSSESLQN